MFKPIFHWPGLSLQAFFYKCELDSSCYIRRKYPIQFRTSKLGLTIFVKAFLQFKVLMLNEPKFRNTKHPLHKISFHANKYISYHFFIHKSPMRFIKCPTMPLNHCPEMKSISQVTIPSSFSLHHHVLISSCQNRCQTIL